jgi:mannose-6-phosphate isomerase-like protein (cupin superfamily)
MKLFSLDEASFEPVSHDPKLKKKVLARDILPSLKHVSHIILQPGDSASEHSHSDYVEVFYCIRGDAVFFINGKSVSIRKGHLLFVEPGETHSIQKVNEETELLYLHVIV